MSSRRIFIALSILILLTKQIFAINYCPQVSAIKCDIKNGTCQLPSQYKNWQIVNHVLLDGQLLTAFSNASIFNDRDYEGTFGVVECFYSGPDHASVELKTRTTKNKQFFFPHKSGNWNETAEPNSLSYYNCIANNPKSCGFTEASAK